MGDAESERPTSVNMVQSMHEEVAEIDNIANGPNENEATTSQISHASRDLPLSVVKNNVDGLLNQREEKVDTSNTHVA